MNYFVSPYGDDSNPGTEALPWRTITKAANTLVAGDTVYIKSGTYNERVIPQNSGSAGNYITYSAYPGNTVTIDGTGISVPPGWGDGLFSLEGKSYITVSGLRVINSSNTGYMIRGSDHIIIENCYASTCQSSGIFARLSTNIVIDGNEITNVSLGPIEAPQENISLSDVDGFEVKNNYVHNNLIEGIDAKDGCRNGIIYGNHVQDSPTVGIYVDAYANDSYNIKVYQNRIHDCGIGLSLATEEGGTLADIEFYNNIVYGCAYDWTTGATGGATRHKTNIKVINNIFCDCTGYVPVAAWDEDDTHVDNLIIRNNIILAGTWGSGIDPGNLTTAKCTIDHNLFYGIQSWLTRGTDYIEADPKFVNPAVADFHLQAGSPAIDNGSPTGAPSDDFDGNSRPKGTGYDIGAYEFLPPVWQSLATKMLVGAILTIIIAAILAGRRKK